MRRACSEAVTGFLQNHLQPLKEDLEMEDSDNETAKYDSSVQLSASLGAGHGNQQWSISTTLSRGLCCSDLSA